MQSYLVMLLASADMLLRLHCCQHDFSELQISSDNLCAPTEKQTCLLMAVPPHQVTQDSTALPICVAHGCLSSADRGSSCAVGDESTRFKVEWLFRIIESFLAKAKGVTTSPYSSSCWLTTPSHCTVRQFPSKNLSSLSLGRKREKMVCCGSERSFHQVSRRTSSRAMVR